MANSVHSCIHKSLNCQNNYNKIKCLTFDKYNSPSVASMIHCLYADTLVNTAGVLALSHALKDLTTPTSICLPSYSQVRGPPRSLYIQNKSIEIIHFTLVALPHNIAWEFGSSFIKGMVTVSGRFSLIIFYHSIDIIVPSEIICEIQRLKAINTFINFQYLQNPIFKILGWQSDENMYSPLRIISGDKLLVYVANSRTEKVPWEVHSACRIRPTIRWSDMRRSVGLLYFHWKYR